MDNTAIRSTLAGILQLTDEQLQRSVRYIVQPAEDKTAWEAVTEHCCLGGCNLEVYTFPTKRDALLFAALLQAAGYRPRHNVACPACYAQHLKETIQPDTYIDEVQ